MSYLNTAADVIEVASKNGLSLQEYILQYGGSYPQEEVNKMAALMSPVSVQLIVSQYKEFEAYYCHEADCNKGDSTWAEYFLHNAQEMACRAEQWARCQQSHPPPHPTPGEALGVGV